VIERSSLQTLKQSSGNKIIAGGESIDTSLKIRDYSERQGQSKSAYNNVSDLNLRTETYENETSSYEMRFEKVDEISKFEKETLSKYTAENTLKSEIPQTK
jgi:hypothetical protein